MHRLHTYDETIREHHVFNPMVYIEDPDRRAGVALYVEGLGYDTGMASVGLGEWARLSWDRIEMNDVLSIDKYGNLGIGCYAMGRGKPGYREETLREMEDQETKYRYIEFDDGTVIDRNPINCGENVELFKALSLYRDDTDYGKIIYYKDPPQEWFDKGGKDEDRLWVNCQWDDFSKCDVEWVKERCVMLNTLEEIKEHLC